MNSSGWEAGEPWSHGFCEQCGARHELSPATKRGRRQQPSLRLCPDCGLLTCRNCYPSRARRCVQCSVGGESRVPATRPVAASSLGEGPSAPPLSLSGRPPDLLAQPRTRSWRRPASPDWRVAGGAALALLAAVVVTIRLVGGEYRGAVAGLTASPRVAVSTPEATVKASPTSVASAASPSPAPSATATPSAAPTSTGPPELRVVESVVIPWLDPFGEVRAHVVASVENAGSARARMPSAESRYTITDAEGRLVAGGVFAHAFPPVLEPGERGFLIDTQSATFVRLEDVATVDVDVAAASWEAPVAHLDVSNVDWVESIDGLIVTGSVTNPGSETVDAGAVAVILLASDGSILGAVYDVTDVRRLEPGATVQFSTGYPGTPPINPNRVATTVGVAFGTL